MDVPELDEALGNLRALCMSMPGVSEKVSHAEPTWFVKKTFVMFANHHHDERLAFWCAAPEGMQEALVTSEPGRFFRPPYVGPSGWLGVRLDREPDWDEIALRGRCVFIAFDSDVMTKSEVKGARDRLTAFLRRQGATVVPVNIPHGPDGEKRGLDDHIAVRLAEGSPS